MTTWSVAVPVLMLTVGVLASATLELVAVEVPAESRIGLVAYMLPVGGGITDVLIFVALSRHGIPYATFAQKSV